MQSRMVTQVDGIDGDMLDCSKIIEVTNGMIGPMY